MGSQTRRPRRGRAGAGAARDTLPPLPGRAELEKLAADLPGLWHAPTTSHKDRKRLLRTLIADVTLLPEPDQHKARIGIRWHTGATDELAVARAAHPGTAKRSPSPAVEMVIRLGPTTPTAELADQLNAAGLTTGTGAPFDVKAVQWIRHAYHIPAPNPYADGEISVAEAAHGSAAAPASSTTGSRPANSPPAAAPATGSASPGPTTSRPNAVPHHRIRAPQPRSPPHHTPQTRLTSPLCRCRLASSLRKDQADQHNSITDPNIPTRDCRRSSMKHPSPPSLTGWRKRWWPRSWRRGSR